ncbi:DUF1798 family protein [Staphylococcus lutrae]|uniref:DUF1798 domain-containing protein n=1 Tax=Staphylococcus lutrae TaxID=155085 RepID=A0AAC9RXH6_9STAP|nr:DUF1798 family protein [Staphylococcus lutrae]ARJ51862.1 hypothetical protein B5P37_11305 [Staphylococcus lutrae]PNZ35927.1 DUF1798 domain-containing protein [Staphylococcus lutrae]
MQDVIQELMNDLQNIAQRYQNVRAGRTYDFYEEIQPFVQKVDTDIHALNPHLDSIIKNKYFTMRKIIRMQSIISELAVNCHQARTSKAIFFSQFKVVQHDLKGMINIARDLHV